ncbi:MAG: hypothetical protein GTO63_32425 [Anaerolineae bacterium]|nr:hypothetical protein [Anaerolineae bacterium]NIN99358.1 hypothetical protein [Anaerolineae bacterium]NIQ82223.1 hypothetical protein [Anaerolineae bacterium]
MSQCIPKRWRVPLVGGALVALALLIGACGAPAPEPTAAPTGVATEAPAPTEAPTEAPPENNPPVVRIELHNEMEGVVDEEGEPIRASGLSNVGVGTYVFLEDVAYDPDEGDTVTTEWEFTPADGSSAELTEGESAYFFADVEGKYDIKLVATDRNGASSEAALTVNAATYVGLETCAMCHADQAEAQAETGHAHIFADGIDGIVSDHYGERCLGCHTVGPWEGENGAFDDVWAQTDWTFPETLQEGNWDALQADYPELANLGNIQCENCHGPGSAHMGDPAGIATSLSAETCGYCHDAPTHHVKNMQWELSGHSEEEARAFTYPIGEGREGCQPCHSGEAFVDIANGMEEFRMGFQTVACAVCHDPHSAENEAQLRIYDTVTLPDGTDVTDAGASATCMTCHNGRRTAEEVEEDDPSWPHHSTAAEMIAGVGGYTYGDEIENSPHQAVGLVCVECHMAETPGMDDAGTPDDSEDDTPLPGHNEIGEHTFTMTSADGVELVSACSECHGEIESFNREADGDYDGDGTVEGIRDEVQGLLDLLLQAIQDDGPVWLGHHPYWEEVTTQEQKAAIYNYMFVAHEGSEGIHNTARAVMLLQTSYRQLTGEDVPGADLY